MKKNLLSLACILLITNTLLSQDYWSTLLKNDRKTSLLLAKSAAEKENSIENLLALEIIRNENGMLESSPNFISKFAKMPDNQYYLYALWNESFFFNNYLGNGFSKTIKNNAKVLSALQFEDKTISSSMSYLMAVSSRENKNFANYAKYCGEIPTIREWQFCGVFENLNNSGLDKYYEPEDHPTNSKPFEANSNGYVNWYDNEVVMNENYLFFSGHREYGSGVHYAQTFLNNPTERKAVLRLGSSGKMKVWVNDVVVFESVKSASTDLDAYNIELNLPKGISRILIKIAGESSSEYFTARITDSMGEFLSDITYQKEFLAYQKSTEESLAPNLIDTKCEAYFKAKIAENPSSFFYKYCLIQTFLRNKKYDNAKEILLPLYEANPKSSLLRQLMITIHSLEEDYTSLNEIKKNLEKEDKEYHLSLTYKFQDVNELFRMSIGDMEKFLITFSEAYNNSVLTNTAKLISALRREDKRDIKSYLDLLTTELLAEEKVNLLKVYAPLYSSFLKDELKYIKILETINKKYFDYSVRNTLVNYYDGQNRPEKALAILMENDKLLKNNFSAVDDIVSYLHHLERYEESLPYIDILLRIYPYSFIAMEYKGDALFQTTKKQEALVEYKKSLSYNSGNSSLRRKIQDINVEEDIIEAYLKEDLYAYINEKRNSGIINNYGLNILLTNTITELYVESGGRSRNTYMYEVTSDEGIDRIKEYNLGLSGNYSIIKSEIVKPDGSIKPADRSGSRLVFTGLEIGDVVLIDYEAGFTSYGRFYKDFVDNFNFDGFHPVGNALYKLIVPASKTIHYVIENKDVPVDIQEKNNHKIYTWEVNNFPGHPQSEDYMPVLVDFATVGHFSTIKDWNEVAVWYSDLVRSQMIIDNQVKKTFSEIFPEADPTKLSETERAERIYYYMMNNFSYSSVSFRQSGYVPQRPSKTIRTKLGDCKDFSTVFVTLAKMAGLEANLALVLTADNGKKDMILPNLDFNHCIAKVMLDGKEQYLELTNKFLPFRALPGNLLNASYLEIPYAPSDDKKFDLKSLTKPARLTNTNTSKIDMYVTSEEQKYKIEKIFTGRTRSYWAEVFEKSNYDVYKKELTSHFQSRLNSNVKVDTIHSLVTKKEEKELRFTAEMNFKEKLNKIGAYKILKIPYIANAYTADIISEDERKYPIEYLKYEGTDKYVLEFNIYLKEEGEFSEIPTNKSYRFKDHSYTRTYTKVGPKHLKIVIVATPGLDNISPAEYPEFKKYVQNIFEAKDEFIGYK